MDNVSQWLVWLLVVTVVPPMLCCLFVLYPIRRYAQRLGLLDRPGGHSTHTEVTPLGGGIGIWLGIMLTFLLGTIAVLVARDSVWLQQYLPDSLLPYLDGVCIVVWSCLGCVWVVSGSCMGHVSVVLGLYLVHVLVVSWSHQDCTSACFRHVWVVPGLHLGHSRVTPGSC